MTIKHAYWKTETVFVVARIDSLGARNQTLENSKRTTMPQSKNVVVSAKTAQERSLAAFPAGSNGEFNLPPELAMVISHGQGCELWDVDGRRYLDFSMGWGSALVGHANSAVVSAVADPVTRGSNFA